MTRFLALLSGLLLVAAVALVNPLAGVVSLALVIASWWYRTAAVVAVLVVIAAIAFSDDVGVIAAAATGLVATTYLLNAAVLHAPEGVVPTTIPSVGGAILFTIAAATAALVPVELMWAPLAAPVLIVLIYAVVIAGLAGRKPVVEAPESAKADQAG
ncbi:hypothetical protein [Nocardia camponoti]|uniref:Uncharacterized protein n=1 Tax=Nocardia camponoti TaxID=1616106 RepID=A0A917QN85_9NOCA|nr:hypothetical protein [Nocardia camponoti]GGK59890.1 hypothetical protein GCM10011591_35210 [Nocardia camponoti]